MRNWNIVRDQDSYLLSVSISVQTLWSLICFSLFIFLKHPSLQSRSLFLHIHADLQMPSLSAGSEPTEHFWVPIPIFKEKEIGQVQIICPPWYGPLWAGQIWEWGAGELTLGKRYRQVTKLAAASSLSHLVPFSAHLIVFTFHLVFRMFSRFSMIIF